MVLGQTDFFQSQLFSGKAAYLLQNNLLTSLFFYFSVLTEPKSSKQKVLPRATRVNVASNNYQSKPAAVNYCQTIDSVGSDDLGNQVRNYSICCLMFTRVV